MSSSSLVVPARVNLTISGIDHILDRAEVSPAVVSALFSQLLDPNIDGKILQVYCVSEVISVIQNMSLKGLPRIISGRELRKVVKIHMDPASLASMALGKLCLQGESSGP